MRLYSRVAPLVLLSLAGWLAACGSDTAGSQTKQPLRITINLPPAYIGEPYSSTITADGGIRPYKYTFDGTLPKGLTYADGRISGTPQEKGNFDLSVTVEDGNLSSRVQKATLSVGDTPPPQLEQVFPLAESADPFIYLLRVRNRETKGFQMQISFKDLKPTLDTLKVADGLLYVMRYNPDTRLMDIDAAFTTPKKDVEMLRLTLTPDKSLRPAFNNSNPLLAFYDKNGNLVANNPQIDRVTSEGKYKFSDLVAIANNWGRKVGAPPASQTAPQGATNAQASNTSAQPGPTPAQTPQPQGQPGQPQTATPAQAPATPSTPPANPQEQNAAQPQAPTTPAAQPEQGSTPTQPAQATPSQPGQATPSQPGQATPSQPGQATPSQPAQTPPAQPAQGQNPPQPPTPGQSPSGNTPAQADQQKPATAQSGQTQQTPAQTQKLEGDLNGDGVVDQKDLDLLRSSYAWASLSGVKQPAPPPANPQNPQNPNPPATPNPPSTPNPNPTQPPANTPPTN